MTIADANLQNPSTGNAFALYEVSASSAAHVSSRALVHSSVGAITLLAPNPSGQRCAFAVTDADGDADTNPITIDGNGNTIDGDATYEINVAGVTCGFIFDGTEWQRVLLARLAAPLPIQTGTGNQFPDGQAAPYFAVVDIAAVASNPNFGNQDVVTTGSFLGGPIPRATTGIFRGPNGNDTAQPLLAAANDAGTGFYSMIDTNGDQGFLFCDRAFSNQPGTGRIYPGSMLYFGYAGTNVAGAGPAGFSTYRGRQIATVEKDANYTLVAGQDHCVIATDPGLTIELPAPGGLVAGDEYIVVASPFGAGVTTVDGNGSDILGAGTTEELNSGESRRYVYDDGAVSGTPGFVRVGYQIESLPTYQGGRLTASVGEPVTASDVMAADTLYFEPAPGGTGIISLFNGATWRNLTFTSVVFDLLTAGLADASNYDLFAYILNGAVALARSAAWAGDETADRVDALALVDGVYVKASDHTRRWIGTFRTTSTTTTEDSHAKRFLWNAYNQAPRSLSVTESTASWTYSAATYQSANASAANAFECIVGAAAYLKADTYALTQAAGSGAATTGIGIDSTTVNSATTFGGTSSNSGTNDHTARYRNFIAGGYHKINWLERGDGANVATFFSNNSNNSFGVSGMTGEIAA